MIKNVNILLGFVIVILLDCINLDYTFAQSLPFNSLTVKEGLSNNDVNCVLQDKNNFIWFGTEDGLNRFDGYDFSIYRNNTLNHNSITANSVWSLFEDRYGYLWIGLKSGELNRYDPYYDKFESWKIDSSINKENSITAIYKNDDEEIWIGTYRNGLYRLNLKTRDLKNWNYQKGNQKSISNDFITSIIEDDVGNLWISTYNGLNKFNPKSNRETFTRFFEGANENSINNNLIWSLIKSSSDPNKIWICTAHGLTSCDTKNEKFTRFNFLDRTDLQFSNSISSVTEEIVNGEPILWLASYAGVLRMNLSNKQFVRYLANKNSPNHLISNQVNESIIDRSGVIWLATEDGISFYSPKSAKFNHQLSLTQLSKFANITSKNIKAICQSPDGTIWFGLPDGLYYLLRKDNVNQVEKLPSSDGLNVWSLIPGESNVIWIGTYGQGLKQLNTKSGSIKSWKLGKSMLENSAFDFVKYLYLDDKNLLWIGYWGAGIARLNPTTGEYKSWKNEPGNANSLSYNDVWVIEQDKFGRIWIGTNGGGINLFNDNDGDSFIRISNDYNIVKNFSSLSVNCFHESPGKNSDETILWIGTTGGLIMLRLSSAINFDNQLNLIKDIKLYTIKDGLSDNTIKSILEDKNGNLWLGSNSGISFFEINSNSFTNFNESDGLSGNDMNLSSAIKIKGNLMIWGSTAGMIFFNPDQINKSSYQPDLVFTGFQIFNENIKAGFESPLTQNICFAKEIRLSHSQNVFSLQFAALDYNSSKAINYAYRMEGFDKDWIYSGSRRFVTYTNLNPGNYRFKVKATNCDGVWSDKVREVLIIIAPPWWRTIWAYILYGIIIIVGLILIRKTELNRARLRNELKVRELEAEKYKELEKIKTRFFANLSHEFRTPLMLIKGPVERLLSGKNINQDQQIKLIERNSNKLQYLIDQLLELTQLESNSISLEAKRENLIAIVRGIFYSFASLAEQNRISIRFNSTYDKIYTWIDRDKLEKILNNILSNAFKFTPETGIITLDISTDIYKGKETALVTVKDTGIGIPKDNIDKIFDRFFQVDDSSRRTYGGSGIGLSLVKELVDLHKWEINVVSELGVGAEFTLKIPLDDNYLNENQKVKDRIQSTDNKLEKIEERHPADEEILSKSIQTKSEENIYSKKYFDRSSILIVDDSEDVRIYLNEILKDEFNILEAENGEKGLLTVMEELPDLIISDVMMPKMNGIEFCQKIKSDWKTSHIPVILLTAKASSENKIEGLETGADDYVTKPFSFRELSVRIKNLLEQRKRLREKFGKDIGFNPENITPNKADQEFLERAIGIVYKNISDSMFDSEKFAEQIFLSRSQLHRKLQVISGQSTGEFIRTLRLKKAAGLILEKKLSVTQVALEVGFNSPSHFTKAFKQIFDCLPSEFIDRGNS